VTAQFSMARMDHGQQEVTLKEAAPGTYTGEVALPMGGEWDVTVHATRDRDTLEQTLTLRVNDGG
jgi:nitrogen fixation protein FixH